MLAGRAWLKLLGAAALQVAGEIVGRGRYIGRSGWTELLSTTTVIAAAAVIATTPQTLWDTEALRPFIYWQVPNSAVAAGFLAAGLLSLAGMVRGWQHGGGTAARVLRSLGMAAQLMLWFWLIWMTLFVAGVGLVSVVLYAGMVVTCFRVLLLIGLEPR